MNINMTIKKNTLLALFAIATINLAFAAAPTSLLQSAQTQKREQKNDGYWLSRNAERFFLVTASAALGALGYWYFGGANKIEKVDVSHYVGNGLATSVLKNVAIREKFDRSGYMILVDVAQAIKEFPEHDRDSTFSQIRSAMDSVSQATR